MMAERDDLVIRVAGEAGEGVLSTGQLITLAAARAGYGVLTDSVPPAEIKGGHSLFQIRLAPPVGCIRAATWSTSCWRSTRRPTTATSRELRDGRPAALRLEPSSRRRRTRAATCSTPLPLTEIAKQAAPVRARQERGGGRCDRRRCSASIGVHPPACSTSASARKGEDDPRTRTCGRSRRASATSSENIPERGTLEVQVGHPRRDVERSWSRATRPSRWARSAAGCRRLRRLPDHPGHRHHGVPGRRAAEGRRLGGPGRGRDAAIGHGARRVATPARSR